MTAAALAALRLRAEARLRLDAWTRQAIAETPLASARLWTPRCLTCGVEMVHVDGLVHRCSRCGLVEARTSQREAARMALDLGVYIAYLLGGNRSGKSALGAMLDVAFALGRAHPAVQAWADLNELDVSAIQEGPGHVWAVALDSSDSAAYVRPKVAALVPLGTRWRNREGTGNAYAYLPNGGQITFKSVDQGRDGFQGDACHMIRFDEEPTDFSVVEESDFRLLDYSGRRIHTMSPLMGWTRLLKTEVEHPDTRTRVYEIDVLDNPHVPRAEAMARLARAGALAEARRRGKITAVEGRVHPDFGRSSGHIVPSFAPPATWPRFGGIDFGLRVPWVHLWAALDQRVGQLHIYREHYQAEWLTRRHAEAIHKIELCPACCPPGPPATEKWWEWRIACVEGENKCEVCQGAGRREPVPVIRWADPEGAQERGTLSEMGIETNAAIKDRRAGYEALCGRLALVEGLPGIVVHDCCIHTIREMEGLLWIERAPGVVAAREEKNMEVKGDDHAWDCLRYLCLGVERAGYSRGAAQSDEET